MTGIAMTRTCRFARMTSPALAAIALALTLPAGATAQDAPLKRLQTAQGLYDIGMKDREPLYVLAAARLRKTVTLGEGDLAPEGGKTVNGQPFGWRDMLASATPMIEGDPVLEGIAEDIEAVRSKGVASGPVYSIVDIRGGGSDVYPGVRFTGGTYAEIYVEGASGTDLNVLVHDEQNRLVCSDTDISAIAYCGWRPAADGTFRITVVNEGSRGGRYSLITN